MNKTKKIIFLSMLVAIALIISLFEQMIPLPVAIPGLKLGLSNIVILVTLVVFGYRDGFVVAILKSLLLVLVTGSVSSFIFSFTGAVLSTISMIFADKYLKKYLSLIGVSLIGSFFHNFGQVLSAAFVLQSFKIFAYLPVLIILGIFTGYFVGLSSIFIVKNLNKHLKEFV